MTHIELPVGVSHHVTLVHFSRPLTASEGEIALEGMEALTAIYGNHLTDLYWGFPEMVGPANNIKASGVECGTDALKMFQYRLCAGLTARGLPVSRDYAEWLPHVTNPPANLPTWSYLPHHGKITLVQRPHRIEVPFPAPAAT